MLEFDSKLFILSVAIFLVHPNIASAKGIKVFNTGSNPSLAMNLDSKYIEKNSEILKTYDPNFTKDHTGEYRGFYLSKVTTKLGLKENEILTIICADNYLMSERVGLLNQTGALVAVQKDGKSIPKRFGGPITMVHKDLTTKDLYPWYIDSFFIGTYIKPNLKIFENSWETIKWSELNNALGLFTSEKIVPSPRGRRPLVDAGVKMKNDITGRFLKDLIKTQKTGDVVLELTLANQSTVTKKFSSDDFANQLLVFKKSGIELPPYEGGPFMIVDQKKKASMPIFFVEKIKIVK